MKNPLFHPAVNRQLTRFVRPVAKFLPTEVLWHLPVVGMVEVVPAGWPAAPVLMVNPGSDRVASMLFWRGVDGWEPTTVRLFLGLLSPGSTVLDVGANSGLFSLLAARREPTAHVHALEPVARVFDLLVGNVAANQLQNVTCHRVACGDAVGRTTIHVPERESVPMMASLVSGWSRGRQAPEDVECVTLDGLVREAGLDRVDVIKIDAEGSEDAVLRGAARTLEQHRPFVFCEVLDRRDLAPAVMKALAGHDYRFFALSPAGVRQCTAVYGGADSDEGHNYLFVPGDRLAEVERILSVAGGHVPGEQDVLGGHVDGPVGEADAVLHPVDPERADGFGATAEDHR